MCVCAHVHVCVHVCTYVYMYVSKIYVVIIILEKILLVDQEFTVPTFIHTSIWLQRLIVIAQQLK
jgi:hypothetical protein